MIDLPEAIGPYKILKKLGQGGFATVYLAEAQTDREPQMVALKALDSPESYARFQREIETVASLNHRNIIRIFDTGQFETVETVNGQNVPNKPDTDEIRGRLAKIWSGLRRKTNELPTDSNDDVAVASRTTTVPFFTMEYVPGGTLRERLEEISRLSKEEALALIKEIGAALTYAHKQGIIHRDVNPNNILLDFNEQPTRPILTDFGLVKPISTEGDNLTMTVGLIGTFHYYAPEQWSRGMLTPATDLYALAITFFEIVSGQRPFKGDIFHLRDMHLNEPLPLLSSFNPEIGPFFDDALSKATAKEPSERYATIAAFIEALEQANQKADDDQLYKEIQELIDAQAYTEALDKLEQNFLRPGKYTYREVPRLLWGLVHATQNDGNLPAEWPDTSQLQTKALSDKTEAEAPEVDEARDSHQSTWHNLNKYFIPLALAVAMWVGAAVAPQLRDEFKTSTVQVAVWLLFVACLLYYVWIYYLDAESGE